MPNIKISHSKSNRFSGLFHKYVAAITGLSMALCGAHTAFAQSSTGDTPLEWSISAGAHVQNQNNADWHGGEIGLHVRKPSGVGLTMPTLEADIVAGLANYRGDTLGDLDTTGLFETRWRALWSTPLNSGNFAYGLAFQTYYNDLNGTTNSGLSGYERTSLQLWLPVRWTMNSGSLKPSATTTPLIWDAGALIWGRHYSKLSQNNASLEDVTNRQNWGLYLQLSKDFPSESGTWRPYGRWTWLDKTDNSRGFREPETHRVQVGVSWSPKF